MSGLTDKQFEMVCRVATTAATVELDGQTATDVRNLPKLLEELLAAARRGLEERDHYAFIPLPDPSENPVTLYLPKPGQTMVIDGEKLNITQVGTNRDDQGQWPSDAWPEATIKGYIYTTPPPPPPNRTVNSNETTGGES